MASIAQIEANRRNAQKSTGPKTPEDLKKASQNSLKHGFTARQALIAGEDAEAFDAHRTALLNELDPIGPMETMAADRIITLSWRLSRTACIQSGTYNVLRDQAENPSPLKRLLDQTAGTPKPQDTDHPAEQSDKTLGRIAIDDFSSNRVLDRLLMYERRIENSFYRAVIQYQQLKFARKQFEREQSAMMDTIDPYEYGLHHKYPNGTIPAPTR